jgi:alkanesulfonate monooxygenase SsuD/methylene tetrahydromethanopterin reductase-like flavin-dependent oxidoreductase (luciferase family)
VKTGLALPSFVDDPEVPIEVARSAEAAGVDGVFVYDHLWRDQPPPRRGAIECYTLLGAIAAETVRVHVGTLVTRATLRPPAVTAHALATAQRISNGRVIAAVGCGDAQSRAENEAFGLEFGDVEQRVAALRATVTAARGRGYPVWVAGNAKYVAGVVAEADGWNVWGGTPDWFRDQVAIVRTSAPHAEVTWAGLALLGRDDAHVAEKAEHRSVGADTVAGGAERVAEQLRAYAREGATWAILGPVDSSDPENATILGQQITPLVRDA